MLKIALGLISATLGAGIVINMGGEISKQVGQSAAIRCVGKTYQKVFFITFRNLHTAGFRTRANLILVTFDEALADDIDKNVWSTDVAKWSSKGKSRGTFFHL